MSDSIQEKVLEAMTPMLKQIQEENRVRAVGEMAALLFRFFGDVESAVTRALEIEASIRRRIQLAKEQLHA